MARKKAARGNIEKIEKVWTEFLVNKRSETGMVDFVCEPH